jgi:hypothetical protein
MEYWKNENPTPIFCNFNQKFIGTTVLFATILLASRMIPAAQSHDLVVRL